MTLPNVVSDCDQLVGLGRAIEREHRVDDRRDPAVGEQRHDVAHERLGRGGLLLGVAWPAAPCRRSSGAWPCDVDRQRRAGPGDRADEHDAPAQRGRRDVDLDVAAAGEIDA